MEILFIMPSILVFLARRKKGNGSQDSRTRETMRSMLMLRCMIIDEISMVSARLLADIDHQLRNYYRHNSEFAFNKKGVASFCRCEYFVQR